MKDLVAVAKTKSYQGNGRHHGTLVLGMQGDKERTMKSHFASHFEDKYDIEDKYYNWEDLRPDYVEDPQAKELRRHRRRLLDGCGRELPLLRDVPRRARGAAPQFLLVSPRRLHAEELLQEQHTGRSLVELHEGR